MCDVGITVGSHGVRSHRVGRQVQQTFFRVDRHGTNAMMKARRLAIGGEGIVAQVLAVGEDRAIGIQTERDEVC